MKQALERLPVQLLVPLHGLVRGKPVISFDCETYGKRNDFMLAVVSTPEGEERFTDPDIILDYLTDERWRSFHVFATQLGFDAFVLFGAAKKEQEDQAFPKGFEAFDNGAKLIWVRKNVSAGDRREHVTWSDSLNIFPAGVEEMGRILQRVAHTFRRHHERTGDKESAAKAAYYDVRKLSAPGCRCAPENEDHEGCGSWLGKRPLHRLNEAEKEEIFDYCSLDSIVTRRFMEWIQREINDLGGVLKLTAASTAMDLFRRRYMREEDRVIPQPHWTTLLESRFSYYGGRTEDFVKGTERGVWDYDVASMYPSSMMEIEFPYPSPERFVRVEEPGEEVLQQEGFSHARVTVPNMHIPPLPWRGESKLLFPIGDLEGTWTHLELRYALSIGCKLERLDWSYSIDKTFNPFQGYVQDLYAKRMTYAYPADCDDIKCAYHAERKLARKCSSALATEEVVKLFLNSLYGKFAQNFLTEEEAGKVGILVKKSGGTFKPMEDADDEEIAYTAEHYPDYIARGLVIDRATPKLKAFMNPILSSYVTSRARVKLHTFFRMAMQEGARVLYTDTDSLYVTKPLSFATEEKVLGSLQVGKEWERIVILGPKSKKLIAKEGKAHFTAKGVPGKSFRYLADMGEAPSDPLATRRTKPRKELFDSLETAEAPTVTYSRFMRFKEAIARGLRPNEIVEMQKTFDPFAFPKRQIVGGSPKLSDLTRRSFETKPWRIKDGEIVT